MITVETHLNIPYTYNGEDRPIEGEVRAIYGSLKVYNGTSWEPVTVTSYANDIYVNSILEWAKKKMEQEQREEKLTEQFPALARAKENYETIRRLVENDSQSTVTKT